LLSENSSPQNQEWPEREIQKKQLFGKWEQFPVLMAGQVFQNQGPINFFSAQVTHVPEVSQAIGIIIIKD
jgi:hypothetical protein